ncbi:siderophore-iron reductase FhuF [Achromobacter spanius]|uniref:siderophore-iron reductase FhuF n=1 Tax=Achromobacter spanius TaxID=217203 RepID=UPI000F8FA4DD|nr:siderophore-iron reductase FhuF [Achromobacter spanius]AZS79610.1 siderophore-iron reductase FhuF [Achromobacter spanius]
MIPVLAPLFPGDWAAHGDGVALAGENACGQPTVAQLLEDAEALPLILTRQARHFGAAALAPVASVWTLTYFWRLLPPVAAAASVLQRVLPTAARQVKPQFDGDGAVLRLLIPHDGQAQPGCDTHERYAPLLHEHLEPLATRLAQCARLSPKITWGNVARYLDLTLSQLMQAMPGNSQLAQDRALLLDAPLWRGEPNPMYRAPREVLRDTPQGPRARALLRRCCLYYMLPGHAYCDLCPLSAPNRPTRETRGA